mmetsp:Transcript_24164/g.34093  ORF Transcript_24164/g.34093 Transcript_24164/m.34093 type:complete len:103 (+) Transcript_24164:1-309(+)
MCICFVRELPFGDVVNWTSISLQIPEKDVSKVNSILDEILENHRDQYDQMKRAGYEAFNTFFHSVEQWVAVMLDIYRERVRAHECAQYRDYLEASRRSALET